MLKYLCLIALLPIPTWEYKIKVEGKLDIGNQIAAFLKEIRARVIEQKMRSLRQGKNETHTETEGISSIAEMTNKSEEDVPLLDEMIKKGEKKMHLYGRHKSDEEKDRNNVNV